MGERVALIVVDIELLYLLDVEVALDNECREYAACKVATIGDKVDRTVEVGLQLLHALHDFGHMLMLERLVDAHVVVAPAEVCSCRRLHTCTCRTCDSIHRDVAVEQMMLCKRKESQLYAGCETSGVGNIAALAGVATVEFGKTIDKVVVGTFETEVHREVDNLELIGQLLAVEELLGVAVSCAEEEHIYLVKGELVGKCEVCLAQQSAVHVCNAVSGIAGAVYKYNFYFGVVEQQTDKFAGCVACSTDDSNFYHVFS